MDGEIKGPTAEEILTAQRATAVRKGHAIEAALPATLSEYEAAGRKLAKAVKRSVTLAFARDVLHSGE